MPYFAGRRQRALQRKTQPSGAERHRAPPGVAEARALRRSAVSQLTDQFSGARPEKIAPPNSLCRAPAKSCSNAYPAFERFRYLRRGARCRSALESWSWLGNKLRLPCAGGGPTKAKITPAKHPTGAPGGRCLPAPGIGHSGEKNCRENPGQTPNGCERHRPPQTSPNAPEPPVPTPGRTCRPASDTTHP